jgi:hydroxypyruvate reductase
MSLKGRVPFEGPLADPRRDLLLDLFRAALAAIDGRRRVRAALAGSQGTEPVSALAVGKAAPAMMLGAADALGARLSRGLVVAVDGAIPAELREQARVTCLEAGHPRPDARSLEAGDALLAFAAATPARSRVLLLVSGGASALLEVPAAGVGLRELVALFERSLALRLDIEQLNRERIALSRIKGGKLAGFFPHAAIEALLLSDVPRDDPAVLASGIADGARVSRRLVGSLDDALEAVVRTAAARGLVAARGAGRLAGDAEAAARMICHELAIGDANLLAFGGETTVALPLRAGRGGRCQHLAVAAAVAIAGHPEYILLAAGTDGRDGASEDAGAIVDGTTAERAADAGLDPASALAAADTGTLLEAAGDLLYTGPTGTNVGDLVLALRQPTADSPAR